MRILLLVALAFALLVTGCGGYGGGQKPGGGATTTGAGAGY